MPTAMQYYLKLQYAVGLWGYSRVWQSRPRWRALPLKAVELNISGCNYCEVYQGCSGGLLLWKAGELSSAGSLIVKFPEVEK